MRSGSDREHFGIQPESVYFLTHSRIISCLSHVTVIIEAVENSGSPITADYTLKQGKHFAISGKPVRRSAKTSAA